MNIVFLVARLPLGLVFFVFGLNGFLHFIPMSPMPAGIPGQFMGALFASHELVVLSAIEVIGGALLLAGQFLPFALTVLGPIVFSILPYHIFMSPVAWQLAAITAVLWFVVFAGVRSAFTGIFMQRV